MKKMRLFMLLSLLMVCLSGIASAQTWDWIISSDTTGFYYSRGSALRLNDNRQAGESGHVKAWLLEKLEDKNDPDRQELIEDTKQYSDKDLSNLYEIVSQREFKNVNGTIYSRFLRWYAYDYDGNCLVKDNTPSKWRVFAPGTYGMVMYEYVLARAK